MKVTQPQAALLHAAESLGIGAIMTVLAALYQYFILHGFNVQGLVGVGCISFIAAFGMVYKSLQSNPNLEPAIADTINELKSLVESHTQAISYIQNAMQAAQAPVPSIPVVPQLQFAQPNLTSAASPAPQLQTFSYGGSSQTYPQVQAVGK